LGLEATVVVVVPIGVTLADAAEGELVPPALVALTVKV
jgi:hypothetical protein